MIKVKKTKLAKELEVEFSLSGNAELQNIDFKPVRATPGSSGYDLRACVSEEIIIYPGEVLKIPTGVHIWIGEDVHRDKLPNDVRWVGFYFPRSSNPGLKLQNTIGVLDSDYQGESFFKYKNETDEQITIQPGEKIGQLVVSLSYIGDMLLVESFDKVTARGDSGFGHTGKH